MPGLDLYMIEEIQLCQRDETRSASLVEGWCPLTRFALSLLTVLWRTSFALSETRPDEASSNARPY